MLRRIHLPSPAIIVALAAVLLAAGGIAGAVSSGTTKVRSAKLRLHYTSCTKTFTFYNCSGPAATATAHYKKGEHATGGGYGKSKDGKSGPPLIESRPSPVSGTPKGWTASTSGAFASSSTPSHPDDLYPIYAVCANG